MSFGERPDREPAPQNAEQQRAADGRWILEELGEEELMGKIICLPDGRQLPIDQWTLIYDDPQKYKQRVEPFILRYKQMHRDMASSDLERQQFEEGLRSMIRYYYDQYKIESPEE